MDFQQVAAFASSQISGLFTIGNATTSIPAMFVALCIAVAFSLARLRRDHDIPLKVLRRAIFPRRIFKSSSGRTDLALGFCGVFVFGFLMSGAILGTSAVVLAVRDALTSTFGPTERSTLAPTTIVAWPRGGPRQGPCGPSFRRVAFSRDQLPCTSRRYLYFCKHGLNCSRQRPGRPVILIRREFIRVSRK